MLYTKAITIFFSKNFKYHKKYIVDITKQVFVCIRRIQIYNINFLNFKKTTKNNPSNEGYVFICLKNKACILCRY